MPPRLAPVPPHLQRVSPCPLSPPPPLRPPVMSPFYALRYGGGEPSPAALQAGAAVYSLDR